MAVSFWTRVRWTWNGLLERFRDPRAYLEDWECSVYCDEDGNRVPASLVYGYGTGHRFRRGRFALGRPR